MKCNNLSTYSIMASTPTPTPKKNLISFETIQFRNNPTLWWPMCAIGKSCRARVNQYFFAIIFILLISYLHFLYILLFFYFYFFSFYIFSNNFYFVYFLSLYFYFFFISFYYFLIHTKKKRKFKKERK